MIFKNSILYKDITDLPVAIAVYGVFDSDDRVLYVGSSTTLRRRLMAHDRAKKFGDSAFCVKWNEYEEKDALRINEHERLAISTLSPPLNKKVMSGRTKRHKWNESMYGRIARERSEFHNAVYKMLWDRIESSISKLYVLDQLAHTTGLSYSWLKGFSQDHDNSPSVDRLELLFIALGGKMPEFKGA